MIRNYLKTAWRSIRNNKGFSLLNIAGLAAGMAVALLIGLWVADEFSYDRWLPGAADVYAIKNSHLENGDTGVDQTSPEPLAATIIKDIPGVKYAVTSDWMGRHSLVAGEKRLYTGGGIVSSDFLNVFRYPLISGHAGTVLQDPDAIVLSSKLATALFGQADPVGQVIRFDNTRNLKVSGVLADIPKNSTLQFSFLVPMTASPKLSWRDHSYQTFVRLRPGADREAVNRQLALLEKSYNPADYQVSRKAFFLYPLERWHLYNVFKNGRESGGFIDYIKMFSLIGLIVLVIACINFTNLSTARSQKRAREVGVRKVLGSSRMSLIIQFLSESLLLTLSAFVISLVLVQLALPAFNNLTGKDIHIPYTDLAFLALMLSYILLTSLLAGSRPAFYLSGFRPVRVLKGTIKTGNDQFSSRKILVVFQFSCSVVLIICTLVVYRQLNYVKERPLGYNNSQLVMTSSGGDIDRNYQALRNDLLASGAVTSVTKSNSPVTDLWASQRIDNWAGKQAGESLSLSTIAVSDADYFETMGMQMLQGRNFSGNASDSLSVILNEAAVRRMRFTGALNQIITWHDVPQQVRVIGVVKDALMASPFSPAEPTIFIYDPNWSNVVTYRLSPKMSTANALAAIKPVFERYNPAYPYSYNFADAAFAAKFGTEMLTGQMAAVFAGLAIFISCLGLLGLAAYTAEQRTREIGIRKVLGASATQVWLLLSREFIILVVISCALAIPVAFYLSGNWLAQYAYRVNIGPWVFILSVLAALLITIATISSQALKAARVNPVRSLRSE